MTEKAPCSQSYSPSWPQRRSLRWCAVTFSGERSWTFRMVGVLTPCPPRGAAASASWLCFSGSFSGLRTEVPSPPAWGQLLSGAGWRSPAWVSSTTISPYRPAFACWFTSRLLVGLYGSSMGWDPCTWAGSYGIGVGSANLLRSSAWSG